MQGSWIDNLRDRWRSIWDVLTGRAYAAYMVPDHMSEVRLRAALLEIEEIADDRADVDDGIPNAWMRVIVITRGALARAG